MPSFLGQIPEVKSKQLGKGLRLWENPGNGLTVLEVFYTADDAKDPNTPEGSIFYGEMLKDYRFGTADPAYRREMLIKYDVPEGRAAHPNWTEAHTLEFNYDPGEVIHRSWDYGRFPAVVYAQIYKMQAWVILRIFNMVIGVDIDFDVFCKRVFEWQLAFFGKKALYLDYGDPAGGNRTTRADKYGYKSDIEFLEGAYNIPEFKNLVPNPISVQTKRGIAPYIGTKIINGLVEIDPTFRLPGIQAHPQAKVFDEGMFGGFCYRELKDDHVVDQELMSNFYKHGHDALRYMVIHLFDAVTLKYLLATQQVREMTKYGRDLEINQGTVAADGQSPMEEVYENL